MKLRFAFPLLLLATAMPIASGTLSYKPALEAYAATSVSNYPIAKLPTTIDLNPVPEADVRTYYAALDGKDLQGEDLLKALKPILKEGQKYNSYDSGDNVWKAYEITDRDWKLSPVKDLPAEAGTYDPDTNTITGYKYQKHDPYNHLLYRNPGVEKARQTAWGKHGKNDGTDREHIWPKSRGFGKDSENVEHTFPGARGDLHHLLPGDSYVNSALHVNNPYGFVDRSQIKKNAENEYKIDNVVVVAGNLLGVSATLGKVNNVNVFEPQDCDKGDIARACFYMAARYNNLAGNDDTIDAGNPSLKLDDTLSTATEMSTATNSVSIGILRDLLVWNKIDPVDDYEVHRNDIIYRNFDGNRNPFIDFPQWADAIWGTSTYDEANHKVTAYNNTPSGKAKPSTDELHQGGSVAPAPTPSSSSSSSQSSSDSGKSDSTPSESPKLNLPMPLVIAIIAGAAVILLIIILIALHGKGKAKSTAKKILKSAAKPAQKKRNSSSKGKKK